MSEMVERVARAIRRRRIERTGRLKAFDANTPPTDNEMDDARAAIEAMREPTPRMMADAWGKISADKKAAGIARLGPGAGFVEYWNAAIDAALSEPQP